MKPYPKYKDSGVEWIGGSAGTFTQTEIISTLLEFVC